MFFRVGFGGRAARCAGGALFAGICSWARGFDRGRSAFSPTTCLARTLTAHFARTGFFGSASARGVFFRAGGRGWVMVLPVCCLAGVRSGGSPGLCANCAGEGGGASFPARGARRDRRHGRLWRLGLGHVGVKEGFTQAGTAVYGAQVAAVPAGAAHATAMARRAPVLCACICKRCFGR
jgi:hypothetical protein